MARGSIVKRCPVCRGKKKMEDHRCDPRKVSYSIIYWEDKKQKWLRAGTTLAAAEDLLKHKIIEVEKKRREIESGTYRERRVVLFKDFANVWLMNEPKPRVKESTFRGYVTDVRLHLVPFFGEQEIDRIRQEHVETFLSKLMEKKGRGRNRADKQLDPKTVNNVRLTLRMILDYARRLKYIIENPVVDVRPYKVEDKEMDFLEPDEIGLLLKHAREPFKTLFFTAIMTGMRRSELAALQWGDIDWNSNTLSVRRSLYWSAKKDVLEGGTRWKFVTPKIKGSIRALFISPKLKEALEIHRISAPVNSLDLVFCNKELNPLDMDHVYTREFLPTLAMAGLRRIRFHDLRHTYATLLISQGENLKFIQSQLGHASITTTMDTYGHLLSVNNVEVGSRLDKLLFGVPSNRGLISVGQEPNNSAKYEDEKALASL